MPVAIVTGAASGIGLALTKHFLEAGWKVTMADMNVEAGTKLAAELGPSAFFKKADVSSWDDQAALFRETFEKFGSIDYVAANAGIDDRQLLYEDVYETVDGVQVPVKPNLKTIEVDLNGPIYSLWLAVFYFRRNPAGKKGKVVITASNAGLYPFPTNPQYASCKHAIVGLVRSVAPIFIKENITVNCICPAFVETNLAPKDLLRRMPREHVTPMSTVLRAFQSFADDDALTGQAAECSLGDIFYRPVLPYPNESERWMFEESHKIWEAGYNQS
ncbi:hypothetical protein BZA70DRAFT_287946 [Myxozyma melibiosi]|uniref:15-hydroxyprostaglandin dehydrogenase n=1 Tax=Myxozyma melibiosi TaxID=54550 RepID=A0ABR1F9E1_9ASCO